MVSDFWQFHKLEKIYIYIHTYIYVIYKLTMDFLSLIKWSILKITIYCIVVQMGIEINLLASVVHMKFLKVPVVDSYKHWLETSYYLCFAIFQIFSKNTNGFANEWASQLKGKMPTPVSFLSAKSIATQKIFPEKKINWMYS